MKQHSTVSIFAVLIVCLVGWTAYAYEADKVTLTASGTAMISDTDIPLDLRWLERDWKTASAVVAVSDVPTADKPLPFELRRDGKTVVAKGAVSLRQADDGAVDVIWKSVPVAESKLRGLLGQASLPINRFAGCRWQIDGKEGILPAERPAKPHFYQGRANRVSIFLPDGRELVFSCAGGFSVVFQDGRAWRGNAYTLRLTPKSSGSGTYAKDVPIETRVHVAITGQALSPAFTGPVRIVAGKDWVPIKYTKSIEAGSAVDFSGMGLPDAPAGKYGWLKNVDGHFEFEGRPGVTQRFYGVNLCFDTNYPDKPMADELVTRLVRLGYNTIRVHHHDGPRGFTKDVTDGLNAEQMDKLDYLLAKCFEKGLYVTTDLYVSRCKQWKSATIPGDIRGSYKALVSMNDEAYADWCKYAKLFLDHVNPYTGRRYADEPGMPLLSMVNEGGLNFQWKNVKDKPWFKKVFADWLAKKRAADPERYASVPEDPEKLSSPQFPVEEMIADVEWRSFVRQRDFVRSLGSKAMLTNCNNGEGEGVTKVRRELFDYVDRHFYVDHPKFLVKKWTQPSSCGNANPVRSQKGPLDGHAATQVATKPYTVTEWNFSGPGMYRGVGGIMTGVRAAARDWGGLWRFTYASSISDLIDGNGLPAYFNLATDPLMLASDRASVCLFLRRDLERAAESGNGVTCDGKTGTLTIDTPRTAGGFAEAGAFSAGPIAVTLERAPATVWASSVDGKPIGQSRRILVSHLTDVQADGNLYRTEDRKILLRWGKKGTVVRDGSAHIVLSLANPERLHVWELETSGRRLAEMPKEIRDGKLAFTAAVRGPHGARLLYEIAE